MTATEHKVKHARFHQQLDKNVACFLKETENLPSTTSLAEFMAWNYLMISKAKGDSNGKK
jgi:DNA-binding transcriptional regulator YhcF (GntR family)